MGHCKIQCLIHLADTNQALSVESKGYYFIVAAEVTEVLSILLRERPELFTGWIEALWLEHNLGDEFNPHSNKLEDIFHTLLQTNIVDKTSWMNIIFDEDFLKFRCYRISEVIGLLI